MAKKMWHEIKPEDALLILLPHPDIQGPLTSTGAVCPWPWEPQQFAGQPIGMFHCGHCGEMVAAGVPHTDYAGMNPDPSDA